MSALWLPCEAEEARIGGKALGLSRLMAAGLPVPEACVLLAGETLETGALAEALARLGGPVAVRSSAPGEDGASASMAGQHESFLEVEGVEAVAEAIAECRRSGQSARAQAYRDANALKDAGVAVVLQRMVAAQVAGVLFTCDPVSGRRDRWTLEATPGLGDALVSGRISPHRLLLDAATGEVLEEGGPACLDAEVRAQLVALARQAELALGGPLDLEWAADGQVWLLQARPVTGLPEGDAHTVWSNVNTAELLPEVVTPLAFWALRRSMAFVLDVFSQPFGVDVTRMPILGLVAGRVYVNLNTVMGWVRTLPGKRSEDAAGLSRLLGGEEEALAAAIAQVPEAHIPRFGVQRGAALRGAFGLAWHLLRGQSGKGGAPAVAWLRADTDQLAEVDDAKLDDAALLARIDACMASKPEFMEAAVASAVGMAATMALPGLLEGAVEDPEGRARRLASARGGMASAQAGRDLWSLAQAATALGCAEALRTAPSAEALEALPEAWRAQWRAWMQEHGHHAQGETDMALPRWREEPDRVLRMLQGLLAAPAEAAPAAQAERRAAERETLERETRAALRWPWQRALLDALLVRAHRGMSTRENTRSQLVRRLALARDAALELGRRLCARGLLDAPEDVFYLEREELDAALEGQRAPVRRRKAALQRWRSVTPPSVIVGRFDPREHAPPPPAAGELLRGIGASPGVVEGLARVLLHSDAEALVRPGEVLVAPSTDPGWTPHFLTAAAVVMDFGGLLSHGSVVAREYGLPAVVNVGDGTRRIRTGDRLQVDGDRGVVRILES
ncbi:MAG: hypothetical protein H6740_08525 [Alphaproteobacteria bacterium]|nr:hypothetical protein [Alphaproteobacteria bacterium]